MTWSPIVNAWDEYRQNNGTLYFSRIDDERLLLSDGYCLVTITRSYPYGLWDWADAVLPELPTPGTDYVYPDNERGRPGPFTALRHAWIEANWALAVPLTYTELRWARDRFNDNQDLVLLLGADRHVWLSRTTLTRCPVTDRTQWAQAADPKKPKVLLSESDGLVAAVMPVVVPRPDPLTRMCEQFTDYLSGEAVSP